ncbi:MAG: hypothetical protein COZ80_08280 [Ignavibacteria bacterium CG_4_8_14_3_um_filter_37_9]|nr:hypothetical protein [Ignavibacteria bacterium]OIO16360.1 MAG: hypothetical protein AUJ54_11535 [Ignavibacteria bacterium CG1_02_37_35]PIP76132.1 MAG: hypothetical protein COW85_15880 [Ignavibacteria bacterium CG22_combo_CG10-13_8_21_14_all_37_15]PIS45010.1 MAG: hypothetical protein COT22_07515 [Ignavibacteria bacterium CG08_land_8_20_14_0_20_37_9]PIW98881.1 MAG: hypothetical protein COZ80_08280 [Ignavibacteria bacterium CG_4_8_14_3_um_filter_37_9]PIX93170.1 MAG: hypothetical protein COZ25_
MPQKDRDEIRKALLQKGFYQKNNDHEFFYYKIDQSIFTKLSHGSRYKTYSADLLGKIKRQLKLNTMGQLLRFIDCPLTAEEYFNLLVSDKIVSKKDKPDH